MSVIDAHQHFWQLGRFQYHWMTDETPAVLRRDYLPTDLRPQLDRLGVDRTVFVQATHDVEETAWALGLAAEHPWIAGVVGWLDLQPPQLEDQLARFRPNKKFVGVRHPVHDEPDDQWLLRDDVIRGLNVLAKHGLPFDVLVRPQHLKHIPRLADRVPDLRMVIDHLAKPPIASGQLEPWRTDLAAVAKIPTMHCKLSGMITEADHHHWQPADLQPYVDTALDLFTPSRLLFGSDWPVCRLAGEYQSVLEAAHAALADLSAAERAGILGENAIRSYGLQK